MPQSSILVLFLFLLYVNNLHLVIEDSKTLMFADDTIKNSGKTLDPLRGKDLGSKKYLVKKVAQCRKTQKEVILAH